jgi:hypothetical protein
VLLRSYFEIVVVAEILKTRLKRVVTSEQDGKQSVSRQTENTADECKSTSSAGSGGATSSSKNSNSLSGMVSTLIPAGLQAAAFVGLFLIFRSRLQRVYRPRTYLEVLRDEYVSRYLEDT